MPRQGHELAHLGGVDVLINALIVVPQRDGGCEWRRHAWERVAAHLATRLPEIPVVEADDGGEPFSRGASLNQAIAACDADVIVALDSDILVDADALREAICLAAGSPGLVQPFDRYVYTDKATTLRLHAGLEPEQAAGEVWRPCPQIPLLGACNVLSVETWRLAGGWLSGFRGWCGEDIAMAAQCDVLAGPFRRVPGRVVHCFHPKVGEYASELTIARNGELMRTILDASCDPQALRAAIVQHGGGTMC